MTPLAEVWGTGSLLFCQLLIVVPLFTGQVAVGDVVSEEPPDIVAPLELLLYLSIVQEACDMGRLGVMTDVGVDMVGGRGGLT